MIGYLEGEVLMSEEGNLLLKTADGIGREVFFKEVNAKTISLYISQIIKEKSIELYGFETYTLKKFFELLLSVNGVGPKSAYSLVMSLGIEQLSTAIAFEDFTTIKKAPGIGPKAAKQIVLDLKDKITAQNLQSLKLDSSLNSNTGGHSLVREAIYAFKELGFSEERVNPLIKQSIDTGTYVKVEDLIKDVLMQLNN